MFLLPLSSRGTRQLYTVIGGVGWKEVRLCSVRMRKACLTETCLMIQVHPEGCGLCGFGAEDRRSIIDIMHGV